MSCTTSANKNMATTVDKVKEKRASQVKLKRTTGFDTEYVEADLKLAEMNFYLLDDVLILAKRYRTGSLAPCGKQDSKQVGLLGLPRSRL